MSNFIDYDILAEILDYNLGLLKIKIETFQMDLLGGLAGILILYCRILSSKLTVDEDKIKQTLSLVFRNIISHSIKTSEGICWDVPNYNKNHLRLGGFSHGVSGISYALAEYFRALGEKPKSIVNESWRYQMSLFNSKTGMFRDLRRDDLNDFDANSWCHGSPGIIMAGIEIEQVSKQSNDKFHAVYTRWYKYLQNECPNSLGICHGFLGNMEIYKRVSDSCFDGHYNKVIYNKVEDVIQNIICNNNSFNSVAIRSEKYTTLGLFTGYAGVIYQLIKLYSWDETPSLLLFE